MFKKLVYIASPYSKGDNFVNTQLQIKTANKLLDYGFIPISPLMNSVWYNMQKERPWDIWMQIDYELILKCDYLLRLEGESKGADLEVEFAKKNNIPVVYYLDCFNPKLNLK
jgi:hypothetical protein